MALPPARIGPYEVLSRLGQGGMAETYVAVRRGPGAFVQHVCLKRIRHEIGQDPELVRQLLAEAAIAAKLRHATIAQVLDFGRDGDDHYLALELVEGLDLRGLLAAIGGPLPPELALHVALQLATALDFAHRAGGAAREAAVVHRDVSPSNVVLSVEGEVKLTDFGIARAVGSPQHTRTGVVKGKVSYIAPEYAYSGRFDTRCDLFAAGVVLYECLCGERPHDGATELETLERASRGEHLRLRERVPGLDARLDELVERLLEPDPALRVQSAAGLLEALLAMPQAPRAQRELGALVAQHRSEPTPEAPALTQSVSQQPPAQALEATRTQHASEDAGGSAAARVIGVPGRGALRALGVALLLAAAVSLLALWPRRAAAPAAPAVAPRAAAHREQVAPPTPAPPASPELGPVAPPHADTVVTRPRAAPTQPAGAVAPARPRLASLEIVVLPFGEVSVDGKRIGAAPVTLSLPPGEHRIRADSHGNVLERVVSLGTGEHRRLVLR